MAKYARVGLLVLVIELVLCAVGALGICIWKTTHPTTYIPFISSYSEVTRPLSSDVMQDLCRRLRLLSGDPKCASGATVYAPEVFGLVGAEFPRGESTYQDVQGKIGRYQYACEEVVPGERDRVFRCWYDFQGDRAFPLGISFKGPDNNSALVLEVVPSWTPQQR